MPEEQPCDVCVIIGSESDVPIIRESKTIETIAISGLSYAFAAISAHRHPDELINFCRESPARVFICACGMNPGLPGAVAAAIKADRPVIGVALPNKDMDPDASKCLAAMVMQPPGVPVLVAGIGKPGLKNAAIAAIQIVGLSNREAALQLKQHLDHARPVPNFEVKLGQEVPA